jgi:hypothetical protein
MEDTRSRIRARIILKRTLDCEFSRIPSVVFGSLPNTHRTNKNGQLGVRYRINRTILHRTIRPIDSSIEMLWHIIHAPDVCNPYSIELYHEIHSKCIRNIYVRINMYRFKSTQTYLSGTRFINFIVSDERTSTFNCFLPWKRDWNRTNDNHILEEGSQLKNNYNYI